MNLCLVAALLGATIQVEPATFVQGPTPVSFELQVPNAVSVQVTSANGVGSVLQVQPAGPGRFKARFVSPKVRFPQVALLAINSTDVKGAVTRHWATLVLRANADLKIETKPNAAVTVTIEGETFGPKYADKKGRVTIAARVPPGVPSATVLAVDRAGNKTTTSLDLAPQPFPRVAAALLEAAATPAAPAHLQLFAVDERGAPLSDPASVKLAARHGAFDPPRPQGAGIFEITYRAPEKLPAQGDEVTLSAGNMPPTVLIVPLKPGAPARVEIAFPSSAWIAGSGPVELKGNVTDAYGNLTPGAGDIRFAADVGNVELTPTGARLTLPDAFGARSRVTVRATASELKGEQALELRAAPPVTAQLSLPNDVVAGETLVGMLDARDLYGNLVAPDAVRVVSSSGRAATVSAAGAGSLRVSYVPDRSTPAGTEALEVRVGDRALSAARVRVLRPERAWGPVVGAQLGGSGNLPLAMLSPRLTVGLKLGGSSFEVAAEGAYGWSPHLDSAPTVDSQNDGKLDLWVASAALALRFRLPVGSQWSVYLAATGGAQRSTWTVGATNVAPVRGAGWGPLVRGSGGAAIQLGAGRLVGQVEYTWAPAPASARVRGNLGGVGLSVGYLVSL